MSFPSDMTAPPAGALEACLALLEKATPGEWRYVPWHIEEADAAVRAPDGSLICCTSSDNTSAAIAAAVNLLRTHGPALLAALRLREWIPVGERLPEHWEHVEVWPDPRDETYSFYAAADGGTNGVKAGRWYHNDRDGYDTEIRVTHWRPLPSPPEGAP